MIARLLLFIKHRLPFLWLPIEALNGLLFRLLHARRMRRVLKQVLGDVTHPHFSVRGLAAEDLAALEALLRRQGEARTRHFQPHGFEAASLRRAVSNPAFLMFGVFDGAKLVGYFFLRCFWNRKCFVGRLIDEPYERRGIGPLMNEVMYQTAWQSGFRCMTTISKHNKSIMRAHSKNPFAKTIAELPNDYLMLEFVPPEDKERTDV